MQNLKLEMIKCTRSSSYRSVGASLAWFKKFPVMKGWSVERGTWREQGEEQL